MDNHLTVELKSQELSPAGLNAPDRCRNCHTPALIAHETQRHWLLDLDTGRDLLKAAARKYAPEANVPLFGRPPELDHVLDAMIDRMGLRDMEEPQTAFGMGMLNLKLGVMLLRVAITRT